MIGNDLGIDYCKQTVRISVFGLYIIIIAFQNA